MDHNLERRERADKLSNITIGAAIEVHRHLGPGLLESAYEECLCHELDLLQIPIACQVPLPILYKGLALDASCKIDIVVDELVILELKAVDQLTLFIKPNC